jgi:hypothetical protein
MTEEIISSIAIRGRGSAVALGPTQPANIPGVKRRSVKLATHIHLVPRSKMAELYLHSPI